MNRNPNTFYLSQFSSDHLDHHFSKLTVPSLQEFQTILGDKITTLFDLFQETISSKRLYCFLELQESIRVREQQYSFSSTPYFPFITFSPRVLIGYTVSISEENYLVSIFGNRQRFVKRKSTTCILIPEKQNFDFSTSTQNRLVVR